MASGSVLLAVSAACTLTGALQFAASQAALASPLTPVKATHTVAPLVSSQPAASVTPTAAVASFATVAPGDTLSSISAAACGTVSDWSGIYAANHPPLADPNVVSAGQVLKIHCYDPGYTAPKPAAPVHLPVTVSQPAPARTYQCGDGDGDGLDIPCQALHHAAAPAAQAASQPQAAAATYTGSGSVQSCIIRAESGGNSQVFNASGHYGLYQFSASTWAGSGGNPADFGHASVAEQNQVFANAVAARGYSDWRPYDGC